MQPPSKPQLSKANDKMWYIFWNHDVPIQLWDKYKRKRVRIKKYDNINRYKGYEREKYANLRLKVWEYILRHKAYSPFDEEVLAIKDIRKEKMDIVTEKIQIRAEIKANDKKNTNIIKALDLYLDSRIERTENTNSISTHRGVVKWFTKYLEEKDITDLTVGKITRQIIADALLFTKKDRAWGPTTYNNHIDHVNTFLNWLVREEYIDKNPATGKLEKVRTVIGKNTWYNKELAKAVKTELIKTKSTIAYNACAFTYHLCIRSQSELLKLKVGDLDFNLKRIRFRKEVSKNGREAFRDFSPEFEVLAKSMNLHKLDPNFYVFGKLGMPSKVTAGKNTLSRLFKIIKDNLNISDEYSIYGWKHTRVIHEMMKGTQPYDIQYLCRHQSLQETEKYMRGFDISLRNVYDAEDLSF